MMNTMSRSIRQKSGASFGVRHALFAATALASCVFSLDAAAASSGSDQVLLAPLGSHRAPSAQVPVYAGVTTPAVGGADQGQNDPSPLSVPPDLAHPVSLSPGATAPLPTTVTPVAASEMAAPAPTPVATPVADSDTVAPVPVPAPTPRPRAVAVRRVPVVEPGDAPYFPSAPVPAPAPTPSYAGRREIPDELRYRPRDSFGANTYQASATASSSSDDGPLLPAATSTTTRAADNLAPAPVVAINDSPRFAPYTPTGAAIPATGSGYGSTNVDPVTQAIDRSITSLRATLAPSVQVDTGYSGHNGQSGLGKMNSYFMPIEGTFSPEGVGQVKLTVTPITISSGHPVSSGANVQTFGSMALGLSNPFVTPTAPFTFVPPAYSGPRPSGQGATGTALDLRYALGYVSADVGTTPVGFQQQNLVGGLEIAPMVTDHTRLRLTLERRAVTETVLSYAGTTDPYTGKHWGGVVKTGGRFSVESSIGLWNVYILGGGAQYTGFNVADNSEYEFAGGATYPIYKYGPEELRTGVDLHYVSFNHNLRYFTYGQGGYFSPQRYVTALAPLIYKNQYGRNVSIEIDGGVGYQEFNEKQTPYFPTLFAQQQALEAKLSGDSLLNAFYPPTKSSGLTGNIAARVDYNVTPNFVVGARANFGNSGVYQSYGGGLYGRYTFNNWYAN